jgi:hypothetical protein
MEHMSTGTRATDPELDEALSRAIRQLIAEAIEAGEGDSASTAALADAQDTGTDQANAACAGDGPGTGRAASARWGSYFVTAVVRAPVTASM